MANPPSQFDPYHEGFTAPSSPVESFPPPEAFLALSFTDPCDIAIWRKAPWLRLQALNDRSLMELYIIDDFRFPDGNPSSILTSWDWKMRCCLTQRSVYQGDMHRYTRGVFQRLLRLPSPIVAISIHHNTDSYCYRDTGDYEYVSRIVRLTFQEIFGSWHRTDHTVEEAAICLSFPILPADFRYSAEDEYRAEERKWERRARIREGLMVPYACGEFESLTRPARARAYVVVPERWALVEVPDCFYVGTPPVVWYYASKLKSSPTHAMWTVLVTEFSALVAKELLIQVYHHFKLWRLTPHLITWIRRLRLPDVLGSKRNAAEVTALLRIIETIDWRFAERTFHRLAPRSDRFHVDALGRRRQPARIDVDLGDFVYYNPWNAQFLPNRDSVLEHPFPLMPQGHPVGLVSSRGLPPFGATGPE